jgi:hypothetical protein
MGGGEQIYPTDRPICTTTSPFLRRHLKLEPIERPAQSAAHAVLVRYDDSWHFFGMQHSDETRNDHHHHHRGQSDDENKQRELARFARVVRRVAIGILV